MSALRRDAVKELIAAEEKFETSKKQLILENDTLTRKLSELTDSESRYLE